MNNEVESFIRNNVVWNKIPNNIKQNWILNQKEYEKQIVDFSIKNQLRHKENIDLSLKELQVEDIANNNISQEIFKQSLLFSSFTLHHKLEIPVVGVRFIKKDAKQYYEDLLSYSRQSLMLYPYHLSDIIVSGLRVTPFQYYISMMENIMAQERSYDSLPNFTAADCVRLLGIGRNEYIDLMNKCRSGRKIFRKRNVKDLLPNKPVKINIEKWWMVQLGLVTEDDIKTITPNEKAFIDKIIDYGKQRAGDADLHLLLKLYSKGLIYLEVPIEGKDYIVVPPLEGFVMNRVLGDYFETLLYKIFVSIDEHTSVAELANVLQIDLEQVKNAVSLYCRLGFAKKKIAEAEDFESDSSWNITPALKRQPSTASVTDPLLLELDEALAEAGLSPSQEPVTTDESETNLLSSPARSKRIAFLFDSTLTAFLMMGNLSPGLKNHAVTMFEVGKLSDESLDSLLSELEKISTDDSEGEAQRYFDHALVLRSTILFLRQNPKMDEVTVGVDLIRCESLQSLDAATCSRLLNKNYALLVSMAPLSKEIRPITSSTPPHLGPATLEVNSVWFKFFIYSIIGDGPPSLLLSKGTRLRQLPKLFKKCTKVLVTTWGHDPTILPISNLVFTVNEALCHSAVLVQGYGEMSLAKTTLVPFPISEVGDSDINWSLHPAVKKLSENIDLKHNCGFLTMVNLNLINAQSSTILKNANNNFEKHGFSFETESNNRGDPELISPVNGITSQEFVNILEEELDNLEDVRKEKNDSEVAVNLSKNKNEELDKWTLLDCDFGIPLFSAKTNQLVCNAICEHRLWEKTSLDALKESSKKLSIKLLDFIHNLQECSTTIDIKEVRIDSSSSGQKLLPTLYPKRNLVFNNGNLRFWNE